MSTTFDSPPPVPARRLRTAGDLLHDLGDISPDRILLDPPPGMASEADLVHKMDSADKQLCELVDGTLVEKVMGTYESLIGGLLYLELMNFIRPRKLGVAIPGDGPLRLKLGLVRIPDISYISAQRLPDGKFPRKPIAPLVPDLAVEILSPGNTPGEMNRKLADYFDAGVRLVWLIDPIRRSATVYTAPDRATELGPDGRLDGQEVLAGFSLTLRDLFDAADAQLGQ